jgi:tRNA(Ile)-lysidine synthase
MASSGAEVVPRVQRQAADALVGLRLARSSRPIVVAVSGGADSLCLLDTLVATLPRAERRLIVGHVDHQLRRASNEDADHVRAVASGYGLRCEVVTVDVPALAEAEGRGIEEAARLARYRALRDVNVGLGASVVATGHTRDDSIETVLLHLLRGSGSRGLSGIRADELLYPEVLGEATTPSEPKVLRLVRPLLKVRRADTVAYCEARGIRWLTDETNADPAFLRNRVRGHLLPVLRTYNPAIDDAVNRLSRVVRDEEDFLDDVAGKRFRRLARQEGGRVNVDLARWRRLRAPIQRRLVRMVAASAGVAEISFEAVERALAVGSDDGPPKSELGGGLFVERGADALVFDSSGRGAQ